MTRMLTGLLQMLTPSTPAHKIEPIPVLATPASTPVLGQLTDPEIEAAISRLAAQEGRKDDMAKPELQSESQFFKLMTNDTTQQPGEPDTKPCGVGCCGNCHSIR